MTSSISRDIYKFLVVGIFFTIAISSCRNNDLETYNPTLTAINERDLGNQLYQVILDNHSKYNYLSDIDYPELYEYLRSSLRLIETQTEIRDIFNWDILVLTDDNSQNIFTLPGGKIIITTGLLKYLEGEYQLVALLGHEAYYADRENDGAPRSLSTIMQKMKDSFVNNRGLGTKVFMEIIEGELAMAEDIILECENISYDPIFVFEADAYSINMICSNYLYMPSGLRSVLRKAEMEQNVEFRWLNNKPPSLVNDRPPEFTFGSRLAQLELNELPCISNEFESSDEFQARMNQLP